MQFPEFTLKDDTGQELPSFLLENMHFIVCFAPDLSDETLDMADGFDAFYQKLIIRNIITMVITPCSQEDIREKVLERDIKVKMMSDPGNELLKRCGASGRTTYFVGKDMEILAQWNDDPIKGHADRVYERLKTFFKPA
jgi:peroxiredoxin